MLYICIPVYNEAPTIGPLIWRIRRVLGQFPREYEVVVVDDGSTDATLETLEGYREVMPLTIVRHDTRKGYGAALDTLVRTVAGRTRYPRRDGMIVMQGDFTDQPEHIPELMKRFEGGADIVVAEQGPLPENAPASVRRLRRVAPRLLRMFVKVEGVTDPLSSLRLYRISSLRDALRESGEEPLVTAEGWAANVQMLTKVARFARRVETVELRVSYDLRPRESRVRPWAGVMELFRFGRTARVVGMNTT
ncbi:MAG: glycosyltransferase family 2 protein [Gemmatimonadaceae bacterium]|nr:glycosyltransferase family 2 protein [Gemmatimonadaceae bacterium]MDQ3518679.1 glycosyltransferase family 2 protein [Gemmatimonadota bacterium]